MNQDELILDPDVRRVRYSRAEVIDLLRIYDSLAHGVIPRRPAEMLWQQRLFRSQMPASVWPRLLKADLDWAIAALPGSERRLIQAYLSTLPERKGGSLRAVARRYGLPTMTYWHRFHRAARHMADLLNGNS